MNEKRDIFKLLAEKGFNINHKNKHGKTLHDLLDDTIVKTKTNSCYKIFADLI